MVGWNTWKLKFLPLTLNSFRPTTEWCFLPFFCSKKHLKIRKLWYSQKQYLCFKEMQEYGYYLYMRSHCKRRLAWVPSAQAYLQSSILQAGVIANVCFSLGGEPQNSPLSGQTTTNQFTIFKYIYMAFTKVKIEPNSFKSQGFHGKPKDIKWSQSLFLILHFSKDALSCDTWCYILLQRLKLPQTHLRKKSKWLKCYHRCNHPSASQKNTGRLDHRLLCSLVCGSQHSGQLRLIFRSL